MLYSGSFLFYPKHEWRQNLGHLSTIRYALNKRIFAPERRQKWENLLKKETFEN